MWKLSSRHGTWIATLLVILAAAACNREPAKPVPSGGAAASSPSDKAAAPKAADASDSKPYATYEVDGRKVTITQREYDNLYSHIDLYYRVFVLTEDTEDKHVWLHLLRLEEAKQAGIIATDRDVREHLTYLWGGEFDDARYQEILDFDKIPRAEFEETVRGIVMGEKLIDFYRDTARALDADVIKRFVDRATRYTLTCVAFPYTDYLEGDDIPLPPMSKAEIEDRMQSVTGQIDDRVAAGTPQDDPDLARLRETLAELEKMKSTIAAIDAREEAAFKRSKKAADDVKKEMLDACWAANQPLFDEYAAKAPERTEAAIKELADKMAPAAVDDATKQKIASRIALELKQEAQHATKPNQAKFFDDVVKKRSLAAFDVVDYRIDWDSIDLRVERERELGHKPDRADYERFVVLNTTIPRLMVGQIGGVFPDPVARAHYVYLMRAISVADAKTIDPLSYRVHRKHNETIRRNQMEAMFSAVPIMLRHKLFVLEGKPTGPVPRPAGPPSGTPSGAPPPGGAGGEKSEAPSDVKMIQKTESPAKPEKPENKESE